MQARVRKASFPLMGTITWEIPLLFPTPAAQQEVLDWAAERQREENATTAEVFFSPGGTLVILRGVPRGKPRG